MKSTAVSLAAAAILWGTATQEPQELQPREVRSTHFVDADGAPLTRRDIVEEQGADFLFIDFDLLDGTGAVVGYGREQTCAFLIEGEPRLVRHLFVFESARAIRFAPAEGDPIAWIRETGCFFYEAYSAVRRWDDETLVIDVLGSGQRRTILGAKEWDDSLLEAFGDFTTTVDAPPREFHD
ncbi:MAG: hypothetical protein AAGA20_13265 [Planctomycetota bacterium]